VLEAARGGDRQALEALLVAHYDRVHALCRRMLGNETDALDATQDALLAAVRALDRFDGRSSLATWLYRITTNTCIDELRRRRRRPVPGYTHDIAEPGDSWVSSLWRESSSGAGTGAGVGPGAGLSSDSTDAVATRVDVERAVMTLPVELRTAVVLRDVCDLPYEEIAAIMDVPIGTVRSRIARGRAAVAGVLDAGSGVRAGAGAGAGGGEGAGAGAGARARERDGNPGGAPDVQTQVGDESAPPGSMAPQRGETPP
jgi:RNA polymerase sigma-70 factor (ECF subfamily)